MENDHPPVPVLVPVPVPVWYPWLAPCGPKRFSSVDSHKLTTDREVFEIVSHDPM